MILVRRGLKGGTGERADQSTVAASVNVRVSSGSMGALEPMKGGKSLTSPFPDSLRSADLAASLGRGNRKSLVLLKQFLHVGLLLGKNSG